MHTCLRPHACFSDRIATPTLLLPTSNRSGVDTCGVASGHTQMTMPPCARSFSGHYESLPLAIGCRTQRAESVLGNIPQMAPAFRSTTLVSHHGLEGRGVIANRRAIGGESRELLEGDSGTVCRPSRRSTSSSKQDSATLYMYEERTQGCVLKVIRVALMRLSSCL